MSTLDQHLVHMARDLVVEGLAGGASLEVALLDALDVTDLLVQSAPGDLGWVVWSVVQDEAAFSVSVPVQESWDRTRVVGLATLLSVPFFDPSCRDPGATDEAPAVAVPGPVSSRVRRPLEGWESLELQVAEHTRLNERIARLSDEQLSAVHKARAGKSWPMVKARFDALENLVSRAEGDGS